MKKLEFPDIKPLVVDKYCQIISTGIGLPEEVISNQYIIDEYNLLASDRAVQYSLGIKERRWANSDEKLEDLMALAVKECLDKADMDINQINRVIYSKLSGDYQVPATSIGLMKKLGATVGIPAFDITSACSGFIHAMDLAIRYIASGDDYVIIVGGSVMGEPLLDDEKSSQYNIFLFGDAIAAMLLGPSDIEKIISTYIVTSHGLYDNAYIEYGTSLLKEGLTDIKAANIIMKISDGRIIHDSSVEYSRVVADKLLSLTEFSIDDLDFFVTSDQSTGIWQDQLKTLGIPEEKSTSLYYKHGNTVAAMSPLNLHELIESGRLKRGDLVMMQAHGAGASSGGVLFRY
ncbi:MAG: ketoacyl-ACP synthase III [Halanaerobiales bacterium]